MKSFLSFSLLIFSLNSLSAQVLEIGVIPWSQNVYAPQFGTQSQHKSTACGLDTVQYPLFKAVGLAALNINSSTSAGAAGQYYDAPQTITITGFDFYAYAISLPSLNVLAQLYLAGPDSLPIGAPLASTSVSVDSTFGGGALDVLRKTAVFTTPVTLSAPYILVVSNNSINTMGLISSAYATVDGQQEWLGSLLIGASWLNGYDVNVGGTAFDADWLFHPIVSYSLTASFVASPPCITAPSTVVSFTNTSSGVLSNRMYNQAVFLDLELFSYSWDFGNGTSLAYAIDTTVNFAGPEQYDVVLTDTIYGWTSTCFHDTTISLGTAPISEFSFNTSSLNASFYDSSEYAVLRLWDFGDGTTSSAINPSHSYAAPGTYTTCYSLTNLCGTDSSCQSVTVSCAVPLADFSSSSSAFTSIFSDLSTGILAGSTWAWDFGDGNYTAVQSPAHEYASTGSYVVCLITSSICGGDTICKTVDIVCDSPVSNFTNNSSSLNVDFTNTSTASPAPTYAWDFGDGNISSAESPSHTYIDSGSYTVCLTVSNVCGADTSCQTVDVVLCNNPLASFTLDGTNSPSFIFASTSSITGTATYAWDFGDGGFAALQNANHTFANSQVSYEVCLIVTDVCGQDTACRNIDVTTGIQTFSEIEMRFYPNPSTGIVAIEFQNAPSNYSLNLLNALGQNVYNQVLDLHVTNIDLSHLNKGLYFIELSTQNTQYVQKLLLK
jgi:PKD repeat protein